MLRLCLDLNVWCSAILANAAGRRGTAAQTLVEAVRAGESPRGQTALVMSWGMLGHLAVVLNRDLRLTLKEASDFVALAESYSIDGPSLTLGGVGVLPIHDAEDRHVLETAWSGGADILTTADVRGFVAPDAENLVPGRVWRLRRADRILILAHPFETAAWLRGEEAFGVGER